MYIPNDRLSSEIASIQYVFNNDEKEAALLIKAQTPALKALIVGSPMKLLFGKKDNYLCVGAKISDMPDSPALILTPQIESEDHKALIQSINQRKFAVFLFNEMDINLASSTVEITEEISNQLTSFIGAEDQLYVGKLNDEVSHAVDCFVYSIDQTQKYKKAEKIPTIEACVKINDWKTNDIYFFNNDSYSEINIASTFEGRNFENTIWSSLISVFPTTLYKRPTVKNGEKTREFTDVFAFYRYGSFLIEAKDLSVIKAGFNRNTVKRVAGIKKQSEKAIKQLVGAANAFKRGDPLFDIMGNEISVDRKIPPHCIVLITELMTSGDWDNITKQLLEAMEETGALFHLLDLREFITLLKQSSGKPELIDYNLMERCKFFCKKKSVFIRGI